MRQGEDTMMPNWALDAIERLTLAADIRILIFLTRHRAYRGNTFTVKQLGIALEIDLRTVQASTGRLQKEGLIVGFDGVFCSKESASRVQAPRKVSAKTLQKDSPQVEEKAVSDSENEPLNKGSKEERNKGKRIKTTPLPPKGEAQNSTAPDQAHKPITFPEVLNTLTGFSETWASWLAYRRTRRLTTAPVTLTAQLGFLAAQPDPVAVIGQSITNGWQGLFPLKGAAPSRVPRATQLEEQDWDAAAAEVDARIGGAATWN